MQRVDKIAAHVTAGRGLAAELAELAVLHREGPCVARQQWLAMMISHHYYATLNFR